MDLDADARARLLVAAELHDGPLQLLLAAVQELDEDDGEPGRRARALLRDAAQQMRDLLTPDTTPVSADTAEASLVRWCQALQAFRPFSFRVASRDRHLVSQLELGVARELVTNSVRHSGGERIVVRLDRHSAEEVMVSVRDTGSGRPESWEPGFGHTALRAKVSLAGGAVAFSAPSGGGALVSVRLPISRVSRPDRHPAAAASRPDQR